MREKWEWEEKYCKVKEVCLVVINNKIIIIVSSGFESVKGGVVKDKVVVVLVWVKVKKVV